MNIMKDNYIDEFYDRTNIRKFAEKINELLLEENYNSIKELVEDKNITNLSYNQVTKPLLTLYSFNKKSRQYELNSKKIKRDAIKILELDVNENKNLSVVEDTLQKELSQKELSQKEILKTEKRLNFENMLGLNFRSYSERRSTKCFTIAVSLITKIENIVLNDIEDELFRNFSQSDIINLALSEFFKKIEDLENL